MTKIERMSQLFDGLSRAGFSYSEAQALRRIEMTLHRWAEHECNGEIERDETTGKAYAVSMALAIITAGRPQTGKPEHLHALPRSWQNIPNSWRIISQTHGGVRCISSASQIYLKTVNLNPTTHAALQSVYSPSPVSARKKIREHNGTKYLTICENNHRPSGENKRVTIRVHGETAPEFSKAIRDAVSAMLA